jgi:hypothetical protein
VSARPTRRNCSRRKQPEQAFSNSLTRILRWANWRSVLKATFGDGLTADRARYRSLAERDPPPGCVREAYFAIARRGGKDGAASAIAVHAAVFGDFARYLLTGERPFVLIVAATKEQASGILSYIGAYFDGRVPMLVQRITD